MYEEPLTNLCKTVFKVETGLDQLIKIRGVCCGISSGTNGRAKVIQENEDNILGRGML